MKKPDFAIVSSMSIVYFTACGSLWHIGYWSTFDINILQYISVSDIIKSFIFPFLSSALIILFFYLLFNYVTIADNIGKPGKYFSGLGKETKVGKYLYKNRIIFLTIYIIFISFLFLMGNNMKWVLLPFLISIPIGLYLSYQKFFIEVIPHPDLRNFIFIFLVLLPLLSFGLAKQKSLTIQNNIEYKIVIAIGSNSQTNFKIFIGYKYLGSAGNKVFISRLDNSGIILLNDDSIDFIEYQDPKKIVVPNKPASASRAK